MKSVSNIKPLGFNWKMYDPFLFCAHHKDHYPKGMSNLGPDPKLLMGRNIGNDFVTKDGFRMYHGESVPGFPVHPHRGFETITITLEGLIDHADSLGGAGRYGNGDVQWMTAGKGIQHTEMFPLLNQNEDNPLELFQIWLNLPKAGKFVEPYYKMLWSEDVPEIRMSDETGKGIIIKVIAGTFNSVTAVSPTPDSWAANPENELAIWLIKMEEGAEFELPSASDDITRAIYFYKGSSIELDEIGIPESHQAVLDTSTKLKVKSVKEDSCFLLVQGKPIDEPVVQYGPFVMNTRNEIQQAYQDYTNTNFGGWPWDRNDPVHGTEVRRFSKFPGGEEEER
jgi:hypothetical protein